MGMRPPSVLQQPAGARNGVIVRMLLLLAFRRAFV